jgi:hypothetical protein
MDDTYCDAMQRAALDGLVRQFFEVGARAGHWLKLPGPVQGRYGIWESDMDYNRLAVALTFRDQQLGRLVLLPVNSHLSQWHWRTDAWGGGRSWVRSSPGRSYETGQEYKPHQPMPPELFHSLWITTHTACRRYLEVNGLTPQGYARLMFPPRRRTREAQ